jgi:hypothetical protein
LAKRTTRSRYVLCVDNRGYRASLELFKVYRSLRDAVAEQHGYTRVIDESGEDYLFPERFFVDIELPGRAKRAIAAAT